MSENNQFQAVCIGITGGFGSGKTSVANIIRNEGFPVIFTDDLAKKIMNEDIKVRKKLITTFGSESFLPDNSYNTQFIASLVFTGTEEGRSKLELLNSIVHPPVIDEMIRLVDELEAAGEELIFVESALIYEAELEEGFDFIINVSAPPANIFERARARGIPEDIVEMRIIEQLSPEKKANWADFNIDNNGGLEELKNSTLMLLEIIKAMV